MRRSKRGRRLPHRRLQSVLAIAAVATAVALPVMLLSVGGGVVDHELAALENAGFQISVSAAGVHGVTGAHALAHRLTMVPSVAAASPVLAAPVDVFVNGGGAEPALAEGIVPATFLATSPPDQRSLFPNPLPLGDPNDSAHFANGSYGGPSAHAVLLAGPFAITLGVVVGDTITVAPGDDASGGMTFNVTGVFGVGEALLAPTAANALVLPLSDLQVLTGTSRAGTTGVLEDAADTVEVGLTPAAAADPAAVRQAAAAIQGIVPYYGVTALTDEAAQLQSSAAILNGFYLALSSIALTVGLLFLALVQVRRVESERATIAIRRAIGVPARSIAREMVVRASGLAVAGVVGGAVAGIGAVLGLARWGSPTVARIAGYAEFDPTTLAVLSGAVLVLALPAALLATRAALRLNVPEALR